MSGKILKAMENIDDECDQQGIIFVKVLVKSEMKFEVKMLLRQLSLAIKTQLKATKAPYKGHFLPFAASLWHMGGFHGRKGSIIVAL